MTDKTEKSFNQELLDAVEKCSDNLSFEDISRLNGIRLELLRRYLDRQAKNIRNETWDKIYPLLRVTAYLSILVLCLASLVTSSYNPFIYFNF